MEINLYWPSGEVRKAGYWPNCFFWVFMNRHEVEVHKNKQTNQKKRRERERKGREWERTGSIFNYPDWAEGWPDRTEAYLFIILQHQICLELSRQSWGADKISPAWIAIKIRHSKLIWVFFLLQLFRLSDKFPFPLVAFLRCDLHCKREFNISVATVPLDWNLRKSNQSWLTITEQILDWKNKLDWLGERD